MHALLTSGLISCGYVLGLYLLTPYTNFRNRDDVIHIQRRLVAAIIITGVIVAFTYASFNQERQHSSSFLHVLGFRMNTEALFNSVIIVIQLMTLFYLGPVVTKLAFVAVLFNYEVKQGGFCIQHKSSLSQSFNRIVAICTPSLPTSSTDLHIMARNLIVAPISEEIVFRAVIVYLLYPAFHSPWTVVLLAPLFFSPAHLHHALVKHWSGFPLRSIIIESVAQLIYTYIFGCMATLLLMRTGNIVAPILSHIICNIVQLPDLSFSAPPGHGGSSEISVLYPYSSLLLVLHAMGLVLFGICVLPMTAAAQKEQHLYWTSPVKKLLHYPQLT